LIFPRDAFAAENVLDRATARLLRAAPQLGDRLATPRGDHDGQPAHVNAEQRGNKNISMPDEFLAKPAAVLVPIVTHAAGATLLLTKRNEHLSQHAGQIAFPGGKIDALDASPSAAALREAREEIGLEATSIRPLGYLDAYLSSTGYRIVPVVAAIEPGQVLRLNPGEVDEAFEVPLSVLMTPAHHERHSREWRGRTRHFYAISYEERYIWGVTAGIIRNLYERLYA
jgi:8-oxo-dGTP pyrophosphatase MutT (NUDIX family)